MITLKLLILDNKFITIVLYTIYYTLKKLVSN